MPNIPTIPTLAEPRLIDDALMEFQTKLAAEFPWLDHAFGKAIRLTKIHDKKQTFYPAVYSGGRDYLKVFPDDRIGNFSFFSVKNGEFLNQQGSRIKSFVSSGGLIFWFDFRKVYPDDWEQRTLENVKHDVINGIRQMVFTKSRVQMLKIFEDSKKIYGEYTDKEIKDQFLMRPYGGFRIEMEITYFDRKC